jgi:hypothetical protein
MIEAGAPRTVGVVPVSRRCTRPTGVVMVSPPEVPRNAERAQSEGPRRGGVPESAAEDSIEAGVLHLEHSEGASSFARIATTSLQRRPPWVTILLYPTASEREECMLAMLFWVLATLAVGGALAIVWGLYLLARRWL